MRFQIRLLAALFLFASLQMKAQGQMDNWVFGDSAGLNFDSVDPIFFLTGIRTLETCASISDTDGNLLFYTNGVQVWNRENMLMPHGDSLNIGLFNETFGGSSITQGVIIIPFPNSPVKYYVVYITDEAFDYQLQYSVVDMSLLGGLGDVNVKNIPLSNDLIWREKLSAVKHGNGIDWWLVALTGGQFEGDALYFVKFLIRESGIEGPFIQNCGDVFHNMDSGVQSAGQLKFRLDGSKAAHSKGKDVDLYDFDRCTGQFYNYINIDTVVNEWSSPSTYGLEFSSDGRQLYVGSLGPKPYLMQFCIECPEPVQETKKVIYFGHIPEMDIGQLQLASNNKIYVAFISQVTADTTDLKKFISVVNNPNASGLAADFDTLTVYLGGQFNQYSLPNLPNYTLGALAGSPCDTIVSIESQVLLDHEVLSVFPNPAQDVINLKLSKGLLGGETKFTVLVEDMSGRVVLSINANSVTPSIPVDALPGGVYYLNIVLQERIICEPFTIVR